MRINDEFGFPPYQHVTDRHESLSSIELPLIRPNTLFVRTYHPTGFTESGLYVERNTNRPRIWAHVLAFHDALFGYTIPEKINIGDLVLFKRYADDKILSLPAQDPLYEGEQLTVSLIHIDSIQAIAPDLGIPLRV